MKKSDIKHIEKIQKKLQKRDKGCLLYLEKKYLDLMGWDQTEKIEGYADSKTGHITIWRVK